MPLLLHRLSLLAFCMAAACGAAPALAQDVQQSGAAATGPGSVVKETRGAWQLYCRTPPGAREEKCALVQRLTAEDRPNVGLDIVIYEAIDSEEKLLRAVVPLGVLLPMGLGIKIDDQDIGNANFLKCSKKGCIAEFPLPKEVVEKMKTGKNAVFFIFDTPESGIGIPVSLEGFSEGLAGVK